jgi:hypothetical protein
MTTVPRAPETGQPSHPGEASDAPADDHTRATLIPDGPPAPRLDFADLAAVRAWLDDLAARVDDLAAVAEDQTDPPGARMLGRAGAREQIGDAYGSLTDLIALARAGLGGAS